MFPLIPERRILTNPMFTCHNVTCHIHNVHISLSLQRAQAPLPAPVGAGQTPLPRGGFRPGRGGGFFLEVFDPTAHLILEVCDPT